jgi:hypothetical protein
VRENYVAKRILSSAVFITGFEAYILAYGQIDTATSILILYNILPLYKKLWWFTDRKMAFTLRTAIFILNSK